MKIFECWRCSRKHHDGMFKYEAGVERYFKIDLTDQYLFQDKYDGIVPVMDIAISVREWLAENCSSYTYAIRTLNDSFAFVARFSFDDDEEAMLFKMTWL